jgi:hypothetical protein
MTDKKIKAAIIIEMMGRPPEHLSSTMDKLLEIMGQEKNIAITNKKIHELKKVEHKDEKGKIIEIPEDRQLYSTFAEIDLEADHAMDLMALCFKYLPSHIEIIEPQDFTMNNFDLSSIFNEIATKMHYYDAIAKAALTNNQILTNKLKALMQKSGLTLKDITPEDVPKEKSEESEIKEETAEKTKIKKTRKSKKK